MVLNVDNFSEINELYDRNFGDDVLRINAQYIQNVFSNTKGVYRLDSDDFGVIFVDTSREEVTASYNRLQTHYSEQQTHKERRYFFTLSAGCVKFDTDSDTFKLLLKNAHVALDFAKYNGKNNLVFYATQTINRKLRELEISNALKESVDNGFKNFELFVQPQVDALTGKLKGGEALLRWSCEKYGAVSPVEFIPLLEENNYILPVGRWVFEHSVEQLANWIVALPNFQISINVSYLQLLDATFLDFLKKTVEKNKVPYENIIIELTESRFINDKDTLRGIFVQLRTLGIEIAMDDFGTGYSSLEVLKDIPADIVKIDRTFVRNIINSNFDMTFIRFIVELCHSVGMKVCLEGIEELEEMNAVSDINLDFIQGYLFGRPSAHSDFTKENFG
jgi:diguanylate cyclase (GGDEF)-like protein